MVRGCSCQLKIVAYTRVFALFLHLLDFIKVEDCQLLLFAGGNDLVLGIVEGDGQIGGNGALRLGRLDLLVKCVMNRVFLLLWEVKIHLFKKVEHVLLHMWCLAGRWCGLIYA